MLRKEKEKENRHYRCLWEKKEKKTFNKIKPSTKANQETASRNYIKNQMTTEKKTFKRSFGQGETKKRKPRIT